MTLSVKRRDDIRVSNLVEMLPLIEMPDTEPLWDDLKKARLIDSMLNNIPIGQIFLMPHPRQTIGPSGWAYEYRILDGHDRLNAIADFVNGNLLLEDDFKLFENEFVQARGMTFKDLKEAYPRLATRFVNYQLDIQVVEASSKLEIARMWTRVDKGAIARDRGGPLPYGISSKDTCLHAAILLLFRYRHDVNKADKLNQHKPSKDNRP